MVADTRTNSRTDGVYIVSLSNSKKTTTFAVVRVSLMNSVTTEWLP